MQDIFVPHNWRWKLEDGRIWSTKHADFVNEEEAAAWAESNNMTYIPPSPVDPQGQHSEQGLRDALDFYALPFGVLMTLSEAQAAKRALINAGHEAALAGAIAMSDPTPSNVAVEAGLLAVSDPEGLEYVRNALAARRDALLAAVDTAETAEAVRAIAVSYAV
ncbi:hypothetical protein DSECCO2_183680 [anaerobic digester metagenome]